MTRVKLNLASGSVQEREVVTAFTFNNVKYIIFDGESTGSMGLPIILVSKENAGKVVGITDAEEWKNTKECLKKIISGEKLEYVRVDSELKADDIFYRQLTLPIASFDILKSSYEVPEQDTAAASTDQTPVFEPILPEDIAGSAMQNFEPVAPSTFSEPSVEISSTQEEVAPISITPEIPPVVSTVTEEVAPMSIPAEETNNNDKYEELKKEFLAGAEELFNNLYNKLNHED